MFQKAVEYYRILQNVTETSRMFPFLQKKIQKYKNLKTYLHIGTKPMFHN